MKGLCSYSFLYNEQRGVLSEKKILIYGQQREDARGTTCLRSLFEIHLKSFIELEFLDCKFQNPLILIPKIQPSRDRFHRILISRFQSVVTWL